MQSKELFKYEIELGKGIMKKSERKGGLMLGRAGRGAIK